MRLRLSLNDSSAWQNHPAISQPLTTHELPYGSTGTQRERDAV